MDIGHEEANLVIAEIEKDLRKQYTMAFSDMRDKMNEYLKQFKIESELKKKAVEVGELSQKAYDDWLAEQIMMGKQWERVSNSLVDKLGKTNQIARDIYYDKLPKVYAENYTYGTYMVENDLLINTSFKLISQDTLGALFKGQPKLIPKKEMKWNKKKINNAVTQGILQGESMERIAERMKDVCNMNYNNAIKNARTSVTSVENLGRQNAFERAEDLGIELSKEWIATLDERTRSTHAELDGEVVGIDEEFSNGLKYPGDSSGLPEEVYNCRCTMISTYDETSSARPKFPPRLPVSYEEWKEELE